jgi:uncharacterized membrane protein
MTKKGSNKNKLGSYPFPVADSVKSSKPSFSQSVEVKQQFYSGPLPPAEQLKKYAEVNERIVDVIISEFERQHEHFRHIANKEKEREILEAETKSKITILGAYSARYISLFALTISGILIGSGNPISGGIFGGTTIVALVSLFLRAEKDNKEKSPIENSEQDSSKND